LRGEPVVIGGTEGRGGEQKGKHTKGEFHGGGLLGVVVGLGGDGAEGVGIEVFLEAAEGGVGGGAGWGGAVVEGGPGDGPGGAAELGEGGGVADDDFDDGLGAVVGGDPGEGADGVESGVGVGVAVSGDEGGAFGVGVRAFAD
jgi:hypothetical protein